MSVFQVFISSVFFPLRSFWVLGKSWSFLMFSLELCLLEYNEHRFLLNHLLGEWIKNFTGPPILETESTHSSGESGESDLQ